jgi:hypothetical protein
MSDEDPNPQGNSETGTDEEKPLPVGTDFTSDIKYMYTYLKSLKRPSSIDEDIITEMEERLNAWLDKAQEEGWEDILKDNLLDAATTASALAWYGDNRPQEFYKDLNALKTTLSMFIEDEPDPHE